jgi:gamma-glutamyltranspeptidase/glutathione hydrolase
MVNGFLLNNELTDFSFSPTDSNGVPVANRVQANKRPRSSMSPTIVFDDQDRVKIVTGSPGGSRIIGYTAQSIINMIDFGLDPQQAINIPHYMNRNGRTDIESPIAGVTLDYDAQALADALTARSHNVGIISQTSGLSIIQVVYRPDRFGLLRGGEIEQRRSNLSRVKNRVAMLIGGADQRRDGAVGGR